jgi:hypothetical protein
VRLILWIIVFALALAGVLVPAVYLRLASQLPPLDDELQLHALLRRDLETAPQMTPAEGFRSVEEPDFTRLPRDLLAIYVSQMGCPEYFGSAPEEGFPWLWRMWSGLWGIEPPGDGRCERLLALRIAASLGLAGSSRQAVAANKIHRVLWKHELIAYDLAAVSFEPGVLGVEAAAKALFGKDLRSLQLSEVAELMLALPPHEIYDELKQCRNASLIRRNRDYVLTMLVSHSLVSSDRANAAQAHPVACTQLSSRLN